MIVKKAGGKVYGAVFTAAEKKGHGNGDQPANHRSG